jgi:PleD family two-component response regulator
VLAFQDELRATHPLDEAPEYVIRISGGLVRLGSVFADAPALVRGADELLYAAKHRGRDCILHQPRDPARGPTPAWTESCFGAPE